MSKHEIGNSDRNKYRLQDIALCEFTSIHIVDCLVINLFHDTWQDVWIVQAVTEGSTLKPERAAGGRSSGPVSVSKGVMQCVVSQWESERGMHTRLEKASFNEDFNV